MSYPPYHHGSGHPPYPSSHHPPGPYPPPTHARPVHPPSLGFRMDAPMYMPPSGYPTPPPPPNGTAASVGDGSFPSTKPYPPQHSHYPRMPPPTHGHPHYPPPPSHGHPPPHGHLPPPTGGSPYPPPHSSSPYPPPSGGFPSANPGFPHANPGFPPTSPGFPPAGGYPPSTPSYPSYPPSEPSYQPPGHFPHGPSDPTAPPHAYPQLPEHDDSANICHQPQGTPTVVPVHPFEPKSDSEILRKAMKGFGTDEKAIISVLARRSNPQRLQIAQEFKTMYGKDLVKDLKSETSGRFEDLLVALMTPLPQFYAKELRNAIAGLGTDEDVLIEVLCTKSNNEIRTIRHAYHSMFGRTLEEDLRGDTSGTFKRLMVSLCNACRDESMVTNQELAAQDARDLLKAGELRLGTDESTFNMVLCQRNYAQLRLVFEEYYKITGHDFEQAIKNEFSGNAKDGLLAIVRSIRNQPGYFAKCLRGSIAGLGTNDRRLIRLVVTRCEIDMGEIKQNYLAQYGKTLADDIKGDTSGDYRRLLLALIGES